MLPKIPFFRELQHCSPGDFADATKELAVVIFFAFMPIWLGLLFAALSTRGTALEFLTKFLSSGEGLLIAAGLVGPLIYVITKRYGELPHTLTIHFPHGWFFTIVVFGICALASAVFGAERGFNTTPNSETQHGPGNLAAMIALSQVILLSSVVTFFFVSVFRNYLDRGAPDEMRRAQSDFLAQWRQR